MTTVIAGAGAVLGGVLLANSANNEYAAGFGTVIGLPSFIILLGNIITLSARMEARTITKEELTKSNFESSKIYMLKPAGTEFLKSQKEYFDDLHLYIRRYPNKKPKSFQFVNDKGEVQSGYFVGVEGQFVYLEEDKNEASELIKEGRMTGTVLGLNEITEIKKGK